MPGTSLRAAARLGVVACGLAAALGCTAGTESTEVGVRVVNVGLWGKGVQPDVYPAGGTYFFFRPFSDWYTFDTAIQNLIMVREQQSGDRAGDDSLRFKTVDGNDVSVNVTLSWRIIPERTPYLLQFVGGDAGEVEEELVRPTSRAVIRDVLNQLTSESYYQADLRFQMSEEARARLNAVLEPEGVRIEQVVFGEHRFNDEYEQTIRDKKVAEQEAERLVSETEAGAEEMKRDLEKAKGEVSKAIEKALGAGEQRRLEADAIWFKRQKEADALFAEKQARAEGLMARAKALAGAGGDKMVKLEIARALQGKDLVFVPAGGGMDLRTTDMNTLLEAYGVQKIGGK
ncbi:MAG TPA: SPFH domain-containing protein [Myxococcota bacterium]|nr:SPFH domain-containing protein [Myxococcota bacterium]